MKLRLKSILAATALLLISSSFRATEQLEGTWKIVDVQEGGDAETLIALEIQLRVTETHMIWESMKYSTSTKNRYTLTGSNKLTEWRGNRTESVRAKYKYTFVEGQLKLENLTEEYTILLQPVE